MAKVDRPPRGPWVKVWILAVALIVAELGILELFWRARGHEASVVESVQLWCYHRERLEGAGREKVAVLGASRVQIGFVHETFREVFPHLEPVQLAVPGKGPFATLRDLADDESFAGYVLCSLEEEVMQPAHLGDQQEYVDYYRNDWGPGKKVSLLISSFFQRYLAQLQPRLGGANLLGWLRRGQLPLPAYVETSFRRRRIADYTKVNVATLIKTRVAYIRRDLTENPPASAAGWQEIVGKVAACVRAIEARGGRVVIVKYPLKGQLLALQEELLPSDRYWKPLAAEVGTDVIHYDEMPGVEELECPDDSHLDPAGSVAFTRWLALELQRRGIFE